MQIAGCPQLEKKNEIDGSAKNQRKRQASSATIHTLPNEWLQLTRGQRLLWRYSRRYGMLALCPARLEAGN